MEHIGKGHRSRIAMICNAPVLHCKLCEPLNAVNTYSAASKFTVVVGFK